MPIGTPFHARTAALSSGQNWRTWSGYFAASSYDVVHDYEYHAIRNSAGLIDISPLFKYDVRGRDALKLVNRVITRDAAKCAVGQALYGCLCEGDGAVIQDGTVFRLAEDHFRFNLAEPSLRWLQLNTTGMEVAIRETSEEIAALALQGPNALKILAEVAESDLSALKFFRLTQTSLAGIPAIVSRTGYTGDLGYELWIKAEQATALWDLLTERGRRFGIKAAGLLALDVARLEAGFILLEVDYTSAEKAMVPNQRFTPYEISLGWTVDLKKDHFVGMPALRKANEAGPKRQVFGVEIDLDDFEYRYNQVGLPPQYPGAAWRGIVPVFAEDRQVGYATTGAWSPALKKYIALATLPTEKLAIGSLVNLEVLVNYQRQTVRAKVVPLPFFDPPRKRLTLQA